MNDVKAQELTSQQPDDLDVLENLARDWVETGWKHSSREPFNFRERLERFYDWSSSDTQFFDDFDRERRVNKTAAAYAAIWDSVIPSMETLTNHMFGRPSTIISGDLAVMSVQFVTRYKMPQGPVSEAHTLSSLVWRRSGDTWRIIREHGSGLAK